MRDIGKANIHAACANVIPGTFIACGEDNSYCSPACLHRAAKAATPADYETCGDCGFDHDYEPAQAAVWHMAHPGAYGCGDGAGPGAHTINVLGHLTREQRIELYRKARDVEDVCGSPDDACFDEDAYFEALKETPE